MTEDWQTLQAGRRRLTAFAAERLFRLVSQTRPDNLFRVRLKLFCSLPDTGLFFILLQLHLQAFLTGSELIADVLHARH